MSVKNDIEQAKKHLQESAYAMHDIMALRNCPPARDVVGPGDSLDDIVAFTENRTKIPNISGTPDIRRVDYPANMPFTDKAGKLALGTGTAYDLTDGKFWPGNMSAFKLDPFHNSVVSNSTRAGIIYGNGIWIGIYSLANETIKIYRSTDGTNWTNITTNVTNVIGRTNSLRTSAYIYVNTTLGFLINVSDASNKQNKIIRSTDGATWSLMTDAGDDYIRSFHVHKNFVYSAAGTSSVKFWYSPTNTPASNFIQLPESVVGTILDRINTISSIGDNLVIGTDTKICYSSTPSVATSWKVAVVLKDYYKGITCRVEQMICSENAIVANMVASTATDGISRPLVSCMTSIDGVQWTRIDIANISSEYSSFNSSVHGPFGFMIAYSNAPLGGQGNNTNMKLKFVISQNGYQWKEFSNEWIHALLPGKTGEGTSAKLSVANGICYMYFDYLEGATRAYAFFSGIPLATFSVLTNANCHGYPCRITNKKMEYKFASGDTNWIQIPAFKDIDVSSATNCYCAYNSNYFVYIVDNTIYISPDLYERSVGVTVSSINNCYVDDLGRIYANDPISTIVVIDGMTGEKIPFGIPTNASAQKSSAITFMEDVGNHIIWANDKTNNLKYQITLDSATENTPYLEVPAVSIGSVYCDRQVISVEGLGFIPDKIFLSWRGEAQTNVQMADIVITTEYDLDPNLSHGPTKLATSHRKLLTEDNVMTVHTRNTDINTTKYSGYCSGDGFVLNLSVDYIGSICDYVAIGRAAGNDPYMT